MRAQNASNAGQNRTIGSTFPRSWGELTNLLSTHWGLLLATIISLIAYLGLLRVDQLYGTLRGPQTPHTIAWYLLAFIAFVGILIWAERQVVPMKWVWGAAILFRLLLLFTSPTLSDDVYRYIWDGHVSSRGVSPYAYPIDALELNHLDIPARALANHTWMASPYLPAAQWVFSGLTSIFPLKPIYFQIIMVAFDLLAGLLIANLLALVSLPRHRLLLYLWNPLVVVEVAHGAHIDVWMVLLSLAAVWLTFSPRRSSAGIDTQGSRIAAPVLLAFATLTKILPILLLPILAVRWSWRQRILYGIVTVGLLLPAGLRAGWGLTGQLDGSGVFGALRIYGDQWNFNSGLFFWIEDWLSGRPIADPTGAAKFIILVALIVILLIVWLRERGAVEVQTSLRLAAIPMMAYLLLTPTVHPWYTLIVLAFLPFLPPGEGEPKRLWMSAIPWIYLSGSLVFSYLTYLDPLNYGELSWVRQVEWLPTLILVLVALFFGIRSGKKEKQSSLAKL
jgi:multisubunit Na+/H+ antiporter MnhG subunit